LKQYFVYADSNDYNKKQALQAQAFHPFSYSMTTTISSFYTQWGTVAHVSVLVASLLYAAFILYFATEPGGVDDIWRKDGFCISSKIVPYKSSFDWCLYIDVAVSLLLGVLHHFWSKIPSMKNASKIVPMVIAGTVAHGAAHGFQAAGFRQGKEMIQGVEDVPLWKSLLFCAFFWYPLLQASLMKVPSHIVAVLALVVTYAPLWMGGLPQQFGFGYIQTILSMSFHISQLMLKRDEKQRREYFTLPLIAAMPSVLVAWVEALYCDAFFKSLGGHAIYDASIIVGFTVFYLDCYRFHVLGKSKTF
jgi:hypothetical protein